MTTNCNCDMPWGVYLDWLEDQGWDVSELRELTVDGVLDVPYSVLAYEYHAGRNSRLAMGHGETEYNDWYTNRGDGLGYFDQWYGIEALVGLRDFVMHACGYGDSLQGRYGVWTHYNHTVGYTGDGVVLR